MGTSMNINTTSKTRSTTGGVRRRLPETGPQLLPRALYVADVLARGLPHVAREEFRGRSMPEDLARLGRPVLVRSDGDADEVEAYLHLAGGVIALIDTGYGHIEIEAAAATREAAAAAARTLRDALVVEEAEPEHISVAFWMQSGGGGEVRWRDIEAEEFSAIEGNYPLGVRSALASLMTTRAPERGRLILWRGEPGTGKSHALRALVGAWAPWCTAHFIMDPDALLGHGGAYMLDILTYDSDAADRWRLVILEDAGELIASDARAVAGQALSRLLNVADGLLGQGTRTLILITTNEPVGRLHPAARRPGRCLADIEFTGFPVDEANGWLAARSADKRVEKQAPLAELFGLVSGAPLVASHVPDEGFGFARALAR